MQRVLRIRRDAWNGVGAPFGVSFMFVATGLPTKASLTFAVANNFWGKEDAGVGPLLERMHDAKVSCDELKAFYTGQLHHVEVF